MKIAVLATFLLAVFSAEAAPPPSVAGMIFAFSESEATSPFDVIDMELLLNADGTTTGLLAVETRAGNVGNVIGPVLSDVRFPGDGTWSYRITGADTAELTVQGRSLDLRFGGGGAEGRVTNLRSFLFVPFSFRAHVPAAPVVNVSTRAYVAPGRSVFVGFVLTRGDRRVLIRVIGPGLHTFGVAEVLEQPRLTVRRAGGGGAIGSGLGTFGSARTLVSDASRRVGAFPLPEAGDRGVVMRLDEGAYTIEVGAVDSRAAGEVLVEVYQLP